MSNTKQITWERLTALWADPGVRILETKKAKYVLISDLHLGDGGEADDFVKNEAALQRLLAHYQEHGFSLILLGDIEEFWQFDLAHIQKRYNDTVYAAMRAFGAERILRVFGNHDGEWAGMQDPARPASQGAALADEAIKLKDAAGVPRILLVHGHQGSTDADKYSWFSRFFVRLFRGIEPLVRLTGLYGHSSATKSSIAKDYERTFYQWAKANGVIVVCGHSHRAIFASRSYAHKLLAEIAALQAENSMSRLSKQKRQQNLLKISQLERKLEEEKEKGRLIDALDPDSAPLPCYFNTGCGLYSDGMTALEIDDGEMRLVKWNRDIAGAPPFEVYDRESLEKLLKDILL